MKSWNFQAYKYFWTGIILIGCCLSSIVSSIVYSDSSILLSVGVPLIIMIQCYFWWMREIKYSQWWWKRIHKYSKRT